MPKCGSCGKNYDDPSVMQLIRNKDNRWVSICRYCKEQDVDISLVKPGNIAVDDHALATSDRQSIDVTLSDNPLENARNLLASLRNLRQSRERVGRARSHERRRMEMIVHFTLSRDDTRQEGIIKDFSEGGLKIVTSYPLTRGQVVQFDWNIPLPPSVAKMLQSTAEVRRSVKNDAGQYEVGLKFLARQADKGANRRRHRRYKCDMLAYYQREDSELMTRAKVTDISQGGCQMRADEKIANGEVFTVRLIGGGGTKGDLVGSMRVCRAIPREVEFEIGCAFEKMRMEQQPASR